MPYKAWEKTASWKMRERGLATIIRILTLGIAANRAPWQVEYTNRITGAVVRGRGATEAEADAAARAQFATIGAAATAH